MTDTVKSGSYLVNLDGHKSTGTHSKTVYANGNSVTFFDKFGVEHMLERIKKIYWRQTIIINIFGMKTFDWIMYGYI